MYLFGYGAPQDYDRALLYLRSTADIGFVSSKVSLGLIYTHGWGQPRDYNRALTLFREGARQGNKYGMYYMGYMYEKGRGVSVNIDSAVYWYRLSFNNGFAAAQTKIQELAN